MIEVTDGDIAEALRIAKTCITVSAVRNWHETDGIAGFYFEHARTIAKLRIATEALEYIGQDFDDFTPDPIRGWMDMAIEQQGKALQALTQIKDTTHAQ